MISYPIYKIIHFVGIFMLFAALGGISIHAANSARKDENRYRRFTNILHGLGATLILIGGFGMLARLGIVSGLFPGWIWGKLIIWILLGGALMIPYRYPERAWLVAVIVPLLGGLAAYFALYKPF